jgi:hypothetical protein
MCAMRKADVILILFVVALLAVALIAEVQTAEESSSDRIRESGWRALYSGA